MRQWQNKLSLMSQLIVVYIFVFVIMIMIMIIFKNVHKLFRITKSNNYFGALKA